VLDPGVVAGLLAATAKPVVVHVHVSNRISTWEKIAVVFTAIGGLGAMLGAGAAWRAASASGQAAHDARDALAESLKPHVQLEFGQYPGGPGTPVGVRAIVVAPLSPAGVVEGFPATEVLLEFNLASGGHGSETIAVLEPGGSAWPQGEPPYIHVVVGKPDDTWPPDGGDRIAATITYSDVRGVERYQLSRSCVLWPSDTSGVVSFREMTEPDKTRIRP
jgi:hypothetical protein